MAHEILTEMYGGVGFRPQNGFRRRDFGKNLRVFKEIVSRLSRDGPFIGRIITTSKFYAGRLEWLKLDGEVLKFRVKGCHSDGSSNGEAGVFESVVSLIYLVDLQIVADKNGRPISWLTLFEDLFNALEPKR